MKNYRNSSIIRHLVLTFLIVAGLVSFDGSLTAQTVVAGDGTEGYSGDGYATSVDLHLPQDVKVDSSGDLYIADSGNGLVREVSSGYMSTLSASSYLNFPSGLALDGSGDVFLIDSGIVFEIDSSGDLSPLSNGDNGVQEWGEGLSNISAFGIPLVDSYSGNLYAIGDGGVLEYSRSGLINV